VPGSAYLCVNFANKHSAGAVSDRIIKGKIMKKKITVCLAAGVLLFSGHAMAEKIKIAVEGAYPPFSFIDNAGKPVGFDVDIAKALCVEAKLDCEIVTQEWDGLIPGLNARKYSAIVASMTITDERRQVVDFTDSYYRSPVRFMALRGKEFDFAKGGLGGKVIGVQSGTVYDKWLAETYPDAEIRSYPSTEEHNADLMSGRVDLVVTDALALLGGFLQTPEGKDYDLVGPDLTDRRLVGDGVGIAVRKGDDELRGTLNKAISAIRTDGTYDKINKTYFPIDIFGR
jgi:arginine/ornithine transport system substrate-binding protein